MRDALLEAQDQRYADFAKAQGLVRSRVRACPCRLLSRARCQECGSFHPSVYPRHFGWRDILPVRWIDHQRLWRRGSRVVLFTTEPYLERRHLGGLAERLQQYGLRLTISDRPSPWNPGSTLLLFITRQDGDWMPS